VLKILSTIFCWAALTANAAPATPPPASPVQNHATRDGFSFPAAQPVRILIFRPEVRVHAQSTGGLNERNVEWTVAARAALTASLTKAQILLGNDIRIMPDPTENESAAMNDYRALFRAITDAVIVHRLFPGSRLPAKKDRLDWSMGPGIAALEGMGDSDFGLFFYTFDSYETERRKAAQAVGQLFGVGLSPGVHIGYAGLVDLRSGDLVWINADLKMSGDVRKSAGADRRVQQLLQAFPVRGQTSVEQHD
jgi:hypothetical protein